MNMTSIRENSKVFLWVCLIGFVLSLVGVMGSSSGGGGFLGGASLTSLFSDSVNPANFVGKVGDRKITRNEFYTELNLQRNSQQIAFNATDSYYIGRAWEALINNTIIDIKTEDLNLKTSKDELRSFLRNTPPQALQNHLVNNSLFILESDSTSFDLSSYQNALDQNLQWMPEALRAGLNNYQLSLMNRSLPRAKLNYLYSLLSTASENEVKQEYLENNVNLNIDILTIDYSLIDNNNFTVSDAEVEQYYKNNLDDKYTKEESITVDYVLFKNISDENDSLEIILNDELKIKRQNFGDDANPELLGFDQAIIDYEISIEDTLSITQDFTANSGIPLSLGYNRSIVRFAFDQNNGDVSPAILTKEGYAYFRIINKEKAASESLDSVKDDITKLLLVDKKKNFIASKLDNALNNRNSWEELLEEYEFISLDTNQEDKMNANFKSIGRSTKLLGCLSAMQPNDISTIIESNNKLYIVHLNSMDNYTDTDFNEKYDSTRKNLINSNSNSIFANWLQYMSKKLDIIDVRMKSI